MAGEDANGNWFGKLLVAGVLGTLEVAQIHALLESNEKIDALERQNAGLRNRVNAIWSKLRQQLVDNAGLREALEQAQADVNGLLVSSRNDREAREGEAAERVRIGQQLVATARQANEQRDALMAQVLAAQQERDAARGEVAGLRRQLDTESRAREQERARASELEKRVAELEKRLSAAPEADASS